MIVFWGTGKKSQEFECADSCFGVRMLIDDGTNGASRRAIGCAIRVHKKFGPGLLEKAYLLPLYWALLEDGLRVVTQQPLSLEFAGRVLDGAYRTDMIVEDSFIIEVKSVAQILPLHIAQVKTYLLLTGLPVGLLINFNVQVLRHGIRRILHPDHPVAIPRSSDKK